MPKKRQEAAPGTVGVEIDGHIVETQCAWNDHGYRCQHNGVWSDSTNGSGPWYCSTHERARRGLPPRPVVIKRDHLAGYGLTKEPGESSEAFAKRCIAYCKQMLAGMLDPGRINRDWAHKILDRYADGEDVPQISLQYACDALHKNINDIRELRRELEPA